MKRAERSASSGRLRVLKALLVLWLGVMMVLPNGAAGQEETSAIVLVGFLTGLPAGGLALPPSASVTAQIELPLERGSSRVALSIDFTPQTSTRRLEPALVQNDEVLEVGLVVQDGRLVVAEINDHPFLMAFDGTLSGVDGPLTAPIQSERTATVLLRGMSTLSLPFLVTPQTELQNAPVGGFKNGDLVDVKLAILGGRLVAVEIAGL